MSDKPATLAEVAQVNDGLYFILGALLLQRRTRRISLTAAQLSRVHGYRVDLELRPDGATATISEPPSDGYRRGVTYVIEPDE